MQHTENDNLLTQQIWVIVLTLFLAFSSSNANAVTRCASELITGPISTDYDCIRTSDTIVIEDAIFSGNIVVNLSSVAVRMISPVIVTSGAILAIFRPKPLNDTGITTCSNEDTNSLDCPVTGYPWQDAQDGRDVTHYDNSDGHAGFSFTKLAANGSPLSASATSWSCVKDNVTGHTWEVKTDNGGLRDKDNTYTWYNPDSNNNGGIVGTQDGGNCTGSDCDTHGYVQTVNTQGLCGAKDWRMPTIKELENIVSQDRYDPAIDTAYFPNTNSSFYWSGSPRAYNSDYAWYVYFYSGLSYNYSKSDDLYVRLVRGRE